MTRHEFLQAQRTENVPQGLSCAHPIFIKKAKGALITDMEEKEYIDFIGGIGVNNVGHCNEAVIEAIKDQIQKFLHPCFHAVMYEPYIELAKMLNEITPGTFPKRTMLSNSGAEAVENGIKIARHATGRTAVITFQHAFHGRTLLAMSLTSKVKPYKAGFGPFAPEVYRMPYAYCYRCSFGLRYPGCGIACAHHLSEFFETHVPAEQVAALIVEPIQGEGGFIVPPKEFLPILYRICKERGIVFIADEVQTGFGRTGRMFAAEHFDIAPDVLLMAKSIAGGLPLGAVTGREDLMNHPQTGGLGGTFSGNPVSCRAALAVLNQIQERHLLEKAREIGQQTMTRFLDFQKRFEVIGDVRGLGAMVGMELVTDRSTKEPAKAFTKELVERCREKGLLMISAGTHSNIIRTLMPLVITDQQLDKGLSILEESLFELEDSHS